MQENILYHKNKAYTHIRYIIQVQYKIYEKALLNSVYFGLVKIINPAIIFIINKIDHTVSAISLSC